MTKLGLLRAVRAILDNAEIFTLTAHGVKRDTFWPVVLFGRYCALVTPRPSEALVSDTAPIFAEALLGALADVDAFDDTSEREMMATLVEIAIGLTEVEEGRLPALLLTPRTEGTVH